MGPQGEEAYVGLGSNLGDRRAQLGSAFAALAGLPGTFLVARSSLYESAPLEAGGGDYLNAVARLHTTLGPLALLHRLQAIETAAGRQRPYPNAPRGLDLDLLLYGDDVLAGDELTLPHPRLHRRAFVVVPLLEIAADLPWQGGRLDALLPQLAGQRLAKLDR
ncbi:MAG: 2-amino-4-hydroxy-6-hydroxymethyldihydropteridine diphosphokinase [Caldimonas sp.]